MKNPRLIADLSTLLWLLISFDQAMFVNAQKKPHIIMIMTDDMVRIRKHIYSTIPQAIHIVHPQTTRRASTIWASTDPIKYPRQTLTPWPPSALHSIVTMSRQCVHHRDRR